MTGSVPPAASSFPVRPRETARGTGPPKWPQPRPVPPWPREHCALGRPGGEGAGPSWGRCARVLRGSFLGSDVNPLTPSGGDAGPVNNPEMGPRSPARGTPQQTGPALRLGVTVPGACARPRVPGGAGTLCAEGAGGCCAPTPTGVSGVLRVGSELLARPAWLRGRAAT